MNYTTIYYWEKYIFSSKNKRKNIYIHMSLATTADFNSYKLNCGLCSYLSIYARIISFLNKVYPNILQIVK